MTPKQFDEWRARYATMTFEDHQAFSEMVTKEYPSQAHFDPVQAVTFFKFGALAHARVAEFGGYDGTLAKIVLAYPFEIVSWTNYDFDRAAVAHPVCQDPRYRAVVVDRFIWETPPLQDADVLVSTHTIEHFSVEHLMRLLEWMTKSSAERLYLEAPIGHAENPDKWYGYLGTHMLTWGWTEVDKALAGLGWGVIGGWAQGRWLARLKGGR